MNRHLDDVQEYIWVIRKESSWGQKQSLRNYLSYVRQEVDELTSAKELNDKENIFEELADVYMMLEFCYQELYELISNRLIARKHFFLKAPISVSNFACQRNNTLFTNFSIMKARKQLLLQASNYGLSKSELYGRVCFKLENRYPYLLPYKQLSMDGQYWGEETDWKRRKKYYKMMEFCTCVNAKCKSYHQAFDGENFEVIDSKSGKSTYIICKDCKKRIPISQALLFYKSNQDYKVALRAVEEYIRTGDKKSVCLQFNMNPHTLLSLTEKCKRNSEFFKNLLLNRYGY